MVSPESVLVHEVCSAVSQMHRLGIPYADLFSPLHDDGIEDAARRMTILMRGRPLGTQPLELVSPPFYGRYILIYSTDVDPTRRGFAKRHGIGHVAAGHVTEVSYLSSIGDWMSREERVADVFALADLCPFWLLDDCRAARMGWRAIKQYLCRQIRQFTVDWPELRVSDRADLRVALYRTCQL